MKRDELVEMVARQLELAENLESLAAGAHPGAREIG